MIERYWEPPLVGADGVSRLDRLARGRRARGARAARDGGRARLISDVPLGAFLSGGIDSSAIVGLMAGLMDQPVETFTIGFEDRDGFDERPYARCVAKRHGTNHHEFVVHPDAVDLVERLVWHHDQPFGDSSAIPTFLLSEVTRQHVTVALSGDGGDELFAGYERFAAGWPRGATPRCRRRCGRRRGTLGFCRGAAWEAARQLQRFAGVAERGLPDAYRCWISFIAEEDRDALLDGGRDDWALDDYRAIWAGRRAPTRSTACST